MLFEFDLVGSILLIKPMMSNSIVEDLETPKSTDRLS